MMNHHHPQDAGMQGMNAHNAHHSHQSAYQQPLYLTGHEHGLGLNVRYVSLGICSRRLPMSDGFDGRRVRDRDLKHTGHPTANMGIVL